MYAVLAIEVFSALMADFFFSAIASFHVYAGLLLVIALFARGKKEKSLIAALSYGALVDAISPIAPFGTMIVFHGAVWLFLDLVMSVFARVEGVIKEITALFLFSALYAACSGVAHYISINIFTGLTVHFRSMVPFWPIIFSSLATSAVAGVWIVIVKHAGTFFGKWFFIK